MSDELTSDQLQSAMKIPEILGERYKDAPRPELIRIIYNEAIDDAANFVRDLAPHNPEERLTLEAAGREIRKWMTIPKKEQRDCDNCSITGLLCPIRNDSEFTFPCEHWKPLKEEG